MEKNVKTTTYSGFYQKYKKCSTQKTSKFCKNIAGGPKRSIVRFSLCGYPYTRTLERKVFRLPLIVKNVMVSRDDLSPYIKEVAEENDYLKKPRKTLISSYFGTNHFVISNMVKFYLKTGLVVTQIYEFIEFHPEACFKELAEEIVETRRKGDCNPDLLVLALTKKLTGCVKILFLNLFIAGSSLYSLSLPKKSSHRSIT